MYYSAKRHSQQPKGIESEISYWDNNLEEEEEEENDEENNGGDGDRDGDGEGERGEDAVESRDDVRGDRDSGRGQCSGDNEGKGEGEIRLLEDERRIQGALTLAGIEGRDGSNIPQEHSHH